jgi:hypothetical protein
MTSLTTNGATSFQTSNNNIVDFFTMFLRGVENEVIDKYMTLCWQQDPYKTVAVIFNARDRENGKKEKNVSNRAMIWLRKHKFATYQKNILKYISKYGRWKDVLYIASKIPEAQHSYEIKLVAYQLQKDKNQYEQNKSVSLCAKWASSENDKFDLHHQFAHKIAQELFPDQENKMQLYRREYLVPLRKHINIVENYMSSNKWTDIAYDKVPAVASKRLRNAFMKHDEKGYTHFLNQVAKGEKKMKVTGLLPHELVAFYLQNSDKLDETIELQWKAIVENVKSQGSFKNMLAVVDISGSMYSGAGNVPPIHASIALGLLISECSEGIFHKKMLPFSMNPSFFDVKGDTLFEQITYLLKKMDAGFNTNFEAVFDLLLNTGKLFHIPPENMPDKLIVFSDMQFDEASGESDRISESTLHDFIMQKYADTPYKPPKLIYWNLNATNDGTFPVKALSNDVAMISGFSEMLLKVFTNNDNLTPEAIVYEILRPYETEVEIADL